MYAASPALRGDAGCGRRGVLLGFWCCCAIATLAYQLEMRERGTTKASAHQTCAGPLKAGAAPPVAGWLVSYGC